MRRCERVAALERVRATALEGTVSSNLVSLAGYRLQHGRESGGWLNGQL